MRTIFKILITVLAICSFEICFAATINGTNFKDSPVPILGGGYSTDMQIAMGMSCLKDGVIKYGDGGKAVINLGDQKSFAQLEANLNVNVDSTISIDQFSVDAAANYARYVKEDAYSEGFYYFENIILPTKIFYPAGFGEQSLSDFGKMAYKAGPGQFRLSCGDEFIQQEPIGAKLVATIKLNFASGNDRTTFDAHVKGQIGSIFNASAAIQQAINQYHISGTLEVSAYQEGGDPTHLANIFQKCGDHYCITSCSLDNLDTCKGALDGIIKYAQTDLITQVDFKDGKVVGNPMPLGYTYMLYSQIGLTVGDSALTPEIIAARKSLGELYQSTTKNTALVDHWLGSKFAPFFYAEDHKALQSGSNALHNNLSTLNNTHYGAIGCYLDPKNCVAIANDITKQLQPFDEKIMLPFVNSYYLQSQYGSTFLIPIGNNQYLDLTTVSGSKYDLQFSADLSSVKMVNWNVASQQTIVGTLYRLPNGNYQGLVMDQYIPPHTAIYTISSVLNPS